MVGTGIGHLERDGEVRRGMLGVTVSSVTPEVREALAVTVERGAVVTSVLPGSAAEQAGLEISDVVVEIDGEAVTSSHELRNIVGLLRRDQEVNLRLYRNGEEMMVAAVIGDQEGAAAIAGGGPANSGRFRGADLRNIEPDDEITQGAGVMVKEVDPRSRAWAAGLRPGDVIVEVNRQPVSDLDDFNGAIAERSRFTAITAEREDRRVLLLVP
jgi:S1-C subfamily serine protease